MCGSLVYGHQNGLLQFAKIALGSLLPLDMREQLFDTAGLSGRIRQALRDLLAEDAVVMAQGLEPVWKRAGLAHRMLIRSEGQLEQDGALVGNEAW